VTRGAAAAPEAVSLWRPLRTPVFRRLLVADVVSDVGTFMQSVGSAWLMVSLGAGPLYVALTQTASTARSSCSEHERGGRPKPS